MVKAKLRGISTKDRGGASLGVKDKFKPSPSMGALHDKKAHSGGRQHLEEGASNKRKASLILGAILNLEASP